MLLRSEVASEVSVISSNSDPNVEVVPPVQRLVYRLETEMSFPRDKSHSLDNLSVLDQGPLIGGRFGMEHPTGTVGRGVGSGPVKGQSARILIIDVNSLGPTVAPGEISLIYISGGA